jgi:hypothetical protein
MLLKGVQAHFRKNKNVAVDCGHDPWKGMLYGKNLIVWHHGDIPKSRLKNIPQTEFREEWGKAEYVEMHTGHLHHEQTYTEGGVVVRHLPAIAAPTEWERGKGYLGSMRSTVCYAWDKQPKWNECWTIRV